MFSPDSRFPIPDSRPTDSRPIAYRLFRGDPKPEWLEPLRGRTDAVSVAALVELLREPRTAPVALLAVEMLETVSGIEVNAALRGCLGSEFSSLRLAVVASLHRRKMPDLAREWSRLLGRDPHWQVRRQTLRALADEPIPINWGILDASDDPHWRVRHALIDVLLKWSEDAVFRDEIERRLGSKVDPKSRGVLVFLRYRWSGGVEAFPDDLRPDDPFARCPFWDWDAGVLARTLSEMIEDERLRHLDSMPFLLGHDDERIRAIALETLKEFAEVDHLAACLTVLDEPRREAPASVEKLLRSLSDSTREELAREILRRPEGTPSQLAFAIDQIEPSLGNRESGRERGTTPNRQGNRHEFSEIPIPDSRFPIPDSPFRRWKTHFSPEVRRSFVRLLDRWDRPHAADSIVEMLDDPDAEVQLEALRCLNSRGTEVPAKTVGFLLNSPDETLRAEAVRTLFRLGLQADWLSELLDDHSPFVLEALAESLQATGTNADALIRLLSSPFASVRAAAMTPERAAAIVANPESEPAWSVIAQAARRTKTPIWKLEPVAPTVREEAEITMSSTSSRTVGAIPLRLGSTQRRLLGPERIPVAPMSVSGHYGLPVEGYYAACESGIDFFFWEPNYVPLTHFARGLSGEDRSRVNFLAGTFEADPRKIRRDAEAALRLLRVDRLALFLIFWVQSDRRVTPEVREVGEALKREGKVTSFGLSTHNRPLAVTAIRDGWNPVMVRHNPAFRGVEEEVFPVAREWGTSLITFNNTCYGRLLKPRDGLPGLSAADCYRYTLSFPEVTMCWSAPASLDELAENLEVLASPTISTDQRNSMRNFGDSLRREEKAFRRSVRDF